MQTGGVLMKIEESTLDDPMLEELVKESQHKIK
jgi:hypothetical protein